MEPKTEAQIRGEAWVTGALILLLVSAAGVLTVWFPPWLNVGGARPSTWLFLIWFGVGLVSLAMFGVVPAVSSRMDPMSRESIGHGVAVVAGGLGIVASIGVVGGLAIRIGGSGVACGFGSGASKEAMAALGDGPGDLDLFLPDRLLHPIPTAEERSQLDDLQIEGRHVQYRSGPLLVSHVLSRSGGWSDPVVLVPGLGRAQLEERWGPAESTRWRDGEVQAQYAFTTHEGCEQIELRMSRRRAPGDLFSEDPQAPLAAFSGRLVGKSPAELGILSEALVPPRSRSILASGPMKMETRLGGYPMVVMVDEEEGLIVGWTLELGESSGIDMALLEERFGPTMAARAKTAKGDRRMASKRQALQWEMDWEGTVLIEVSG